MHCPKFTIFIWLQDTILFPHSTLRKKLLILDSVELVGGKAGSCCGSHSCPTRGSIEKEAHAPRGAELTGWEEGGGEGWRHHRKGMRQGCRYHGGQGLDTPLHGEAGDRRNVGGAGARSQGQVASLLAVCPAAVFPDVVIVKSNPEEYQTWGWYPLINRSLNWNRSFVSCFCCCSACCLTLANHCPSLGMWRHYTRNRSI